MSSVNAPNTRVEVHGLTSIAGSRHNGKLGTTQGVNSETSRVTVILDEAIGLSKYLNIKPANLKISTVPPLPAGVPGQMEPLFAKSNASGKPLEATVGNEWTQIHGVMLSVWIWMKHGGDADWCNSAESILSTMGATRATLNLVAHKRLHRIPPYFFSTKSPIPLPPRGKKQIFQGIGDIQQAMSVLCTKRPSEADGYAFLQTRAGAFTFQHYPHSGAVTCPDIETSTFYAVPPTRCPVDFHPFTIQETSYCKTGDFKKVRYASSEVTVPTFGYVMSRGWCSVKSKAELKGLKSEKSIYFDAFCAVCKTPNCGTEQMGTMETRGGRSQHLHFCQCCVTFFFSTC